VYGPFNPTVSLPSAILPFIFSLKFLGPVKDFTSAPSIVASAGREIPWKPRGTTYPSSYILTEAPPHSQSSNARKSPTVCPSTKSWRIPDPYDCAIYHDCNHGTDLISYCPAQLQYNPDKQACDYEEIVGCIKSILFIIIIILLK
jgi:hypothetical protein